MNHMLSNLPGPTAATSTAVQPPHPTAIAARQAPAQASTASGTSSRALPYQPVHQLELLNLHAELDALLYQLNATHRKPNELLQLR
ncbi:MAG: hypothetical protein AAF289_22650 [Cyanobacteria bacterium P01_A01_bin.135]